MQKLIEYWNQLKYWQIIHNIWAKHHIDAYKVGFDFAELNINLGSWNLRTRKVKLIVPNFGPIRSDRLRFLRYWPNRLQPKDRNYRLRKCAVAILLIERYLRREMKVVDRIAYRITTTSVKASLRMQISELIRHKWPENIPQVALSIKTQCINRGRDTRLTSCIHST